MSVGDGPEEMSRSTGLGLDSDNQTPVRGRRKLPTFWGYPRGRSPSTRVQVYVVLLFTSDEEGSLVDTVSLSGVQYVPV